MTLASPCTGMEKQQAMGAPARNSAVPSGSPNTALVPVTAKTGTTAGRTGAVPNTEPPPWTTGFPLTATASISREPMPCVPSASDTIPASRLLARSGCGCATVSARPISIPWPISPLWPLLWPLSCPALTPTAHSNPSGIPLSGYAPYPFSARCPTALGSCALFPSGFAILPGWFLWPPLLIRVLLITISY